MSELFESLQFPLQPTSSPSTSSLRSKSSNNKLASVEKSSIRERTDRNRANLHHPDPRTPHSKSEKRSSTSQCHNDSQQYEGESSALKSTPLFLSTPSTTNIIRPGHVYWHESPSPSQQIRQKEIRSYLASSTSPLLPLGTQAFREELLQQQKSNTSSAAALESKQALEAGINGLKTCEKSGSSSGGASTSSFSSHNRKYTRRLSKRFGANIEDADRPQAEGKGMQKLLADLDKHLKNQGEGADGDDGQEESLIEELDRVFSSQKEPTTSMDESDNEQENFGSIEEVIKEKQNIDHQVVSPSNSREWSRTKSLPAARTEILDAPKRPVLVDVAARQSSQMTREPLVDGGRGKGNMKNKTRSSLSPPKKWTTTRTPRIGLSRHSTEPASQVLNHLQNGPAAPFKKPTKLVPVAAVSEKRNGAIPKQRERNVIIIDDSDEDEGGRLRERKAMDQPVRRRTSPRKQAAAQKSATKLVRPVSAPIKTMVSPLMTSDDDSCFDTSMDESMLCEAVDRAEATQEALVNSQKIQSAPPNQSYFSCANHGDDSYEMASSDNEAMVSAMEAGGW